MRNPIEFYKWIRKKRHIEQSYSGKYAFVGIGSHSVNNLYPVLDYLNIPVKYIVSQSEKTADLIKKNYTDVIATTDYNKVLMDNEIKGIFISANPMEHYRLVKKALVNKKNVFVEKPLCYSSKELEDIKNMLKQHGNICLTGMQKRYSSCTEILKKRLTKESIISYNYRFTTGGYPEGNLFWDIFIHPVDLLYFLFGEYEIISYEKKDMGTGQCTILMHTRHADVIGIVEMSTAYTWNYPKEELLVNTHKGIYEMLNHRKLTYMPKPSNIMSMPMDKIFKISPVKKYLFDTNNFLPVFANNEIVTQGYFKEINTFLDLCENKKTKNLSSPETLTSTYAIIENLI